MVGVLGVVGVVGLVGVVGVVGVVGFVGVVSAGGAPPGCGVVGGVCAAVSPAVAITATTVTRRSARLIR
jgi:hypothetical protein